MTWAWVAVGYVSYLAIVSTVMRKFARARGRLLVAAAVAWLLVAVARARGPLDATAHPLLLVVVPALVLVSAYWLSGLLFVRPDLRLERWLRAVDDRLLARTGVLGWYDRAPRVVAAFFELSYLLVYVAVPAGAVTLVLAGHAQHVDRFWTVVLLAELASYGMLPWLQTRPPRVLEAATMPAHASLLRRLNLAITGRASIQVNTIPSGHAAGACATALAIGSTMPVAGAAFMVLAVSIAVASVLGRYHYIVDAVLGMLIAVVVWEVG